MSDLYRIHDEPGAVKRPDEGFYSGKGWLVPVEPDTTVTTDGTAPVFVGLEAGKYLIFLVEADDE